MIRGMGAEDDSTLSFATPADAAVWAAMNGAPGANDGANISLATPADVIAAQLANAAHNTATYIQPAKTSNALMWTAVAAVGLFLIARR